MAIAKYIQAIKVSKVGSDMMKISRIWTLRGLISFVYNRIHLINLQMLDPHKHPDNDLGEKIPDYPWSDILHHFPNHPPCALIQCDIMCGM